MLGIRVIATILLGLSCISIFVKNENVFCEERKTLIMADAWSLLWRAFVITTIWLV